MKYIIQLFTGSLEQSELNEEEAIERLKYCISTLDVDKVIFGWSNRESLNKKICDLLDAYKIEKYFWLPIFAEVQDERTMDFNKAIIHAEKRDINICDGDEFNFACQSSEKSVNRAIEVFDGLAQNLSLDGVFLDRIRYESPVKSMSALFGCWCQRCKERYIQNGVNIIDIEHKAMEKDINIFMPKAKNNCVYEYFDNSVDKLMEAKRAVISKQVKKLCAEFRKRHLKVGIDTFTPSVADFVGQDLIDLGKTADFIKPMTYLRTNAPAGVPFELKALGNDIKQRLDSLWESDNMSMQLMVKQLDLLRNNGACVTPGIDANYIEGICSADQSYVKQFIELLSASGIDTVVLSWNVMKMSKDIIKSVAEFNKEY